MATTIVLKNSVTTTNAPSSLTQGEVAVNVTDKKIWVGNAATTPVLLVNGGSDGVFTSVTDSGLTNTRLTYAGAGGLLKDSANITTDGTTITAAFSGALNGTVGATTPAAGTFTSISGPHNGTVGATTPNTGAFTTLSASSTITATGGIVVGASAAPAFNAYLNATQSISASTFVKIQLNAELFDTNNNFDSTTNNRFTPTVAGYYFFQGSCILQQTSGTAGVALIAIYKNGSNISQNELTAVYSSGLTMQTSILTYMNGSTDYVELYAYSAATLGPSIAPGSNTTWFNGFLARSA
jgi:glutamine amidotransferase-like uncharacterized protein